jgi:hypothetical protein
MVDFGRVLWTGLSSLRDRAATRLAGSRVNPSREQHLEIRPDSQGEFDEIVARFADGMVHAEMMSDKSCYVGFYWDDGRYCQWWFGTNRGKLWNNHEDGIGDPPRYTAHGIDTKPWLPDYNAIATEARRAETLGPVHEGAGPQDIAQNQGPTV